MNAKKLLKQAQFHGLNKLDDAKCRWVWTLSLFVLLLASTGIVASMVLRFLAQPTFIARLERVYANMEYPSVQVCPETSFPEYKIDEFLSQLNFPPDLNMSFIKSIIQQLGAFYSPDVSYTVRQLQRIEAVLDFNNIDVYSAAKKLTVSCEETLMRCRLFGVMRKCIELFTLEISQYGFCCVFNGRSLRSEIRKYGIHKVVPKSVYHTNSVGFRSGLTLAINQSGPLLNVDLTYKWVSIDGGHAYIDSTLNGTPLAPGTEMWLAHRVDGIHIDEDAASLDTALRGCRLSWEPLTLFPIHHKYHIDSTLNGTPLAPGTEIWLAHRLDGIHIDEDAASLDSGHRAARLQALLGAAHLLPYPSKYCHIECEMYRLLQTCGCGMWTHPLRPEAPLCRARALPCARQALAKFNKDTCPCVHTCDVDMDNAEITSFNLIPHAACLDSFYHDLDFSKTSIMRVFKANRMIKTKSRRAYYTFYDLFSQLGGIFNVFFGCSILSVLEIIQLIKYAFQDGRQPSKYFNNKKEVIPKNKGTKDKKREKKVRFCKSK